MQGGSWLHVFWGLLRDNGCVQVFGGVGTGLLLCVFPLFAYHNWFCLVFHLWWFSGET